MAASGDKNVTFYLNCFFHGRKTKAQNVTEMPIKKYTHTPCVSLALVRIREANGAQMETEFASHCLIMLIL